MLQTSKSLVGRDYNRKKPAVRAARPTKTPERDTAEAPEMAPTGDEVPDGSAALDEAAGIEPLTGVDGLAAAATFVMS